MSEKLRYSDPLTPEQRRILEFMALTDGEGSTLASDIANECGFAPRSMGGRLARLEQLALARRVVVRERASFRSDRLYGWVLTDFGHRIVSTDPRFQMRK